VGGFDAGDEDDKSDAEILPRLLSPVTSRARFREAVCMESTTGLGVEGALESVRAGRGSLFSVTLFVSSRNCSLQASRLRWGW
jgi:hypothetical protein